MIIQRLYNGVSTSFDHDVRTGILFLFVAIIFRWFSQSTLALG